MVAMIEPRYMEIGDAARALGVAVETLRKWEREGKLDPPIRTMGGRRLFDPEVIEELRVQRQARQEAGSPKAAA
ncbi:MAG TPA: MerR family transcriptional regulator [Thermomicrobiales bacterium]|jgi:DNA-binding transcriptional MerR regulator